MWSPLTIVDGNYITERTVYHETMDLNHSQVIKNKSCLINRLIIVF